MLRFREFISESEAADAKERSAFVSVGRALKPLNARAFVKPMGSDAGFPDFGFSWTDDDGAPYDMHIEYKMNSRAQMGSMRDWRFNGSHFYTPDTKNESKQELIYMMNGDRTAISNGKRLLKDFRTVFCNGIHEISSGMLSGIKDKALRRELLEQFVELTNNYVVAKVENDVLGKKILDHYTAKFAKVRRGRNSSGLFFMVDNQLYHIAGDAPNQLMSTLGGGIPHIGKLAAKLEVRIQPRGLTTPNKSKPVSIDVMASFRLSGKLQKGLTIR